MYKKRLYVSKDYGCNDYVRCTCWGHYFLVESINLCETCRSQNSGTEIGLFFNASQARQFSLIFAWLCWSTDFSTISCSSLGGACVAAADDRLLSRDFYPGGWSMYNKRRNWLMCSVSTSPLHPHVNTHTHIYIYIYIYSIISLS